MLSVPKAALAFVREVFVTVRRYWLSVLVTVCVLLNALKISNLYTV